jgi:hypothetical protein
MKKFQKQKEQEELKHANFKPKINKLSNTLASRSASYANPNKNWPDDL